MNRLKHIAWIILFLTSCGEVEEAISEITGGMSVEVTREVRITVLPMQSVSTLSTRASQEPEKGEAVHASYIENEADTRAQNVDTDKTADEATIKNAYILQFGGTSAVSVLKKKIVVTAEQLAGTSAITCNFSLTSGVKNRVYVVANCYKTLTENTTTLGDFESPVAFELTRIVPAGGLPLSAFQDVSVDEQFDIFQLKSMLSKLTFTCKTAGATLKLKRFPTGYSFYSQAAGDVAFRPTGMTYNYTGTTLTSGTTYYVPENLSGRNDLLIKHYTRALGMAPANAMYVEITNGSTVYNLLLGDGTPSDFNFSGNHIYNIGVTLYGTDTYDLRIGNPLTSLPIDLNTGGETANCYIATVADAWYMFRSDVMGNGSVTPAHTKTAILSDANFPAIVPKPLQAYSADVLWETQNTTTAPVQGTVVSSNVYLLKDRIMFKAGSTQGNAVIAARDADNKIIWSWHIWRSNSQPEEQPLAAIGTLIADGGLVMMDRNLGALSATPQDNLSTGLLYQWGRKDPFPGGADLSSALVAMATTPSGVPVVGTGGSVTPEMAVQTPTTFYKNPSSPYDWTIRNDNLWGTPLTMRVYVNDGGYNANKGMKSIYDPCPPGWRVPPAYVYANAATSNGGTFSKGYSFAIGQNNAAIWFPAAGSRIGRSGTLGSIGAYGSYWSSMPYVNGPTLGSVLGFDNGNVYPVDNYYRAYGYSCRCVKETFETNIPIPVNLSASGSANCYIVTEPGQYSFDATVMGNGKTTPAHTKGTTSGDDNFPAIVPTKLSPVSAEVLWETFNTTTAPTKGDIVSDVMVMDGKVIFNTGSKEGNAVIAVKDENGYIIWSWHIWRTNNQPVGKPLAAIGDLTTDGEMVLMDRSLGALSATPQDDLSIGLLYQWGRKDPFPGGANLSKETTAIATIPSGVPVVPPAGDQHSVDFGIRNPTTFINYDGDWCSSRNDNLWGTPLTTSVSINGSNFNANKGIKSIYDPCPPGWQTPSGYVFANVSKGTMTLNKGYSFPIGQSNVSSWFPASGYLFYSSGALVRVGTEGYYWTSTPLVSDPSGGSRLYLGSGSVNPSGKSLRSFAFPIRCCKE